MQWSSFHQSEFLFLIQGDAVMLGAAVAEGDWLFWLVIHVMITFTAVEAPSELDECEIQLIEDVAARKFNLASDFDFADVGVCCCLELWQKVRLASAEWVMGLFPRLIVEHV